MRNTQVTVPKVWGSWSIPGPPERGPVTFNCAHHGDYSGEVIIDTQPGIMEHELHTGGPHPYESVRIPFQVMQELVAHWLMTEQISSLEQTNPLDYLKGLAR